MTRPHRPTALETIGLGLTEALSNIARDVRGENLIEAEPKPDPYRDDAVEDIQRLIEAEDEDWSDDEPPYDIDPDFEARFRAEEKANQADREIYEARADTGDDWDEGEDE